MTEIVIILPMCTPRDDRADFATRFTRFTITLFTSKTQCAVFDRTLTRFP